MTYMGRRIKPSTWLFRMAIAIAWIQLDSYSGMMACRIQGFESGECVPPDDFDLLLPFCSDVVQYTSCLPRFQSVWFNHSSLTKDRWVQQMYEKIIVARQMFETDSENIQNGQTPWGELVDEIVPRFSANEDCKNAFKNFFCWLNFPRCDDEGRSLVMCRSVCENFFKSCQQPQDLIRCGYPQYVDGYEPEISTAEKNGELIYNRFTFPGSPFRDNAFEVDGVTPLIVCTPSIENTTSSGHPPQWLTLILMLFSVYELHSVSTNYF